MPGTAPATTHDYDFFALSPGQFEDLVSAVIEDRPNRWTRRPEAIGRLGSDHGRDIRITERVGRGWFGRDREWLFQVKREKEVGPEDLRKIVRKAVPDPSKAPYAFVVAVASGVSSQGRSAFDDEAHKAKIKHYEVWDKFTFQTALQKPSLGRLAAFYFGDGSAIEGTTHLPLSIDRSPGRDAPLSGRDELVSKLKATTGDIVLVGAPGTGKTRLAVELDDVRFLAPSAGPDVVAESLRDRQPASVVIDDAGFELGKLGMLLDLRREGYHFRLVATAWPGHIDAIRRILQPASEIVVDPLERKPMDDLIQSIGVRDPYWRAEILDQAQGRPGWAMSLIQLGTAGHGGDVASGRALIGEIRSLVGPTQVRVLALLALMSALGTIDRARDLPAVETFLRVSQLELAELLAAAASAGVIDETDRGLTVAPQALRRALVRNQFFDESPAPASIERVLTEWPDRRASILSWL